MSTNLEVISVMTMQLNKAVVEKVSIPAAGVGYAQPSLEVLSCLNCAIKGACLAKQMTIEHGHSYQVVKNKKVVAKGRHIFRGGDRPQEIYIVSKGSVKSYVLMENGEEQVLNFYMPGDVFGLDAMDGSHCISSAVALEDTTVCKLPVSGLQDRVLGPGFLKLISDNLLREHNLMLMLARKDADGRLASFLMDMHRRLDMDVADQPSAVIRLAMTRQDIANYLGLAIETVSRALRRFQNRGVLEVARREVKIYDFDSLVATAGTQVG